MTAHASASQGPYLGARVAFATMHHKERCFAGPLEEAVGAVLVVASVDTDAFGTFSGERPRMDTARATAAAKARAGMAATGLALGLASEGSYGPHPEVPFLAAGEEFAVWIDDDRGIEVVERLVTTATNYTTVELDRPVVPPAFLARSRFPDHRLVVTTPGGLPTGKGIGTRTELDCAVRAAFDRAGRAVVQTDMRAHHNPTRQADLRRLALALGERLATACPRCRCPGWGAAGVGGAKSCPLCGGPTRRPGTVTSVCASSRCGHTTQTPLPGEGDATWCDRCNP